MILLQIYGQIPKCGNVLQNNYLFLTYNIYVLTSQMLGTVLGRDDDLSPLFPTFPSASYGITTTVAFVLF